MPAIYNHNFDEAAYREAHSELPADVSAYRHLITSAETSDLARYTAEEQATVSIIVPCYRAEAFLEHTLESVRQQTFKAWECICVDDFSNDGTIALIKKFIGRDKRFRLIPHRANGGANAARNTGIRSARGTFTCFLDSDDLLLPRSIANRVGALLAASHYRLAGSYSASQSIDESCTTPPDETESSGMKLIDFITASGLCPFNANQPMFKTAVLRQLGGFDQRMRQAEDWEFWTRILRHGYFFVPTYRADVTYRDRSASQVRSAPLDHLSMSLQVHEAAHSHLPPTKSFADAPFVFEKPWIDYKRQLDIARRVFEFCGMAMSDGEVNNTAVELTAHALPDFFDAISTHRNMAGYVEMGVRRQMVGGSDEAARYAAQALVERYTTAWRKLKTPPARADKVATDYPMGIGPDPGDHRAVDVVFLPHKDYHVWSFALVLDALREAGITYTFVDLTVIYRDERARSKLRELDLPSVPYNEFVLGNFRPKLVVCMNDWDPIVRSIVHSCQELGIPTVGVVEGVQDYLDVDTGRVRAPYRTVDYVLLPGDFDRRYFDDDENRVRVGGVPRVDELLAEDNAFPDRPLVVINSNFTYNVLTDQRDEWVRTAVEACKELGYDYLISRHPADQGDFSDYDVADESMYDLIRRGSVFLSRFGSGILESLAMGKPAIYYNPHAEKVDKFTKPNGAFPISSSKSELVEHLRSTVEEPERWMAHAADYVELHCGARRDAATTASERLARELVDIFRTAPLPDDETRSRLKYLLLDDGERKLGDPLEPGRRAGIKLGDYRSPRSVDLGRYLDRVAGMRRKVRKLRRSPRAFFEDSKVKPLNVLKHLF